MKKYIAFFGAAAALGFVIAGCGGSENIKGGQLRDTLESEGETSKYVTAIGIGGAPADITESTRRKASSRNAAIVAAQYDLVSRLKGVKLEGGVTIERAMETDSKIKATVDAMIKGANVAKTEWTNDDGCVVTLQLNKKELGRELGKSLE